MKTIQTLLADATAYLNRYMVFPASDYATVAALYAIATHLWPHFDAFPYLHITSKTKRSGKTRLSELLGFMAANARNFAGATAATIFHSIKDESPTIFLDEIETFSSEAASVIRSVLNVGYRRGQVVPRMGKNGVVEWPAYCPKVFIGIGDLYDTLRDRTIAVQLVRGQPKERFLYEVARADGEELRDRMHKDLTEARDQVLEAYSRYLDLSFLSDRDAEIWLPLFAVCQIIAPDMVEELKRIAVDMATEKTAVSRRFVDLKGSETQAEEDEYSVRLLRDLHAILAASKKSYITSGDALDALKAIKIAPWRKFRGDGLTVRDIAKLLGPHHVAPRNIKMPGTGHNGQVKRGYRKHDIDAALRGV